MEYKQELVRLHLVKRALQEDILLVVAAVDLGILLDLQLQVLVDSVVVQMEDKILRLSQEVVIMPKTQSIIWVEALVVVEAVVREQEMVVQEL
jgi:hypothetical protein